jgi:hypothetical protein
MNELVAYLLHMASMWTGYAEPASPPRIEIVSEAQMPCPCLGIYLYKSRYAGYGAIQPAPGLVMLRQDVDIGSALGRSILLHELVHALQAQEGPARYGSPLWYQREREAYRVQHRFLRASGVAAHNDLLLRVAED